MKTHQIRTLAVTALLGVAVLTGCGADGKSDGASDPSKPAGTASITAAEPTDTTESTGTTDTTEADGGSGGGSTDREDFVDAMTASMVSDGDFPAGEKEARCYSEATLDVIGVDSLVDAGYTADDFGEEAAGLEFEALDLDEKQANAIFDAFGDCGIDLQKIMQESFSEDGDLTPEQKACFEDVFGGDGLRTFFVTAMVAGEDDEAAMEAMGPLMACAFLGMDDADLDIAMD